MTLENALRYLDYEAGECRGHDAHEALCLLLPALRRAFDLQPMNGYEAGAFRSKLKQTLETDFRFDREPSRVGCGGPT